MKTEQQRNHAYSAVPLDRSVMQRPSGALQEIKDDGTHRTLCMAAGQ